MNAVQLARHCEAFEWLANRDAGVAPSCPAEANDRSGQIHLQRESVIRISLGLGVPSQMDAFRCTRVRATDEVLVDLLAQEWHGGRQQSDQRDQTFVEGRESGVAIVFGVFQGEASS